MDDDAFVVRFEAGYLVIVINMIMIIREDYQYDDIMMREIIRNRKKIEITAVDEP